MKVIDVRLSSLEPTDLQGLPWFNNGKAQFQPFDLFPLEDTPIPQGYQGFLLFLDEFNSASRAVQAAAYKVVLDRMIGNHKLHDKCFIICAGNKTSDNAITTRLSTAMLSRLVHINLEVDFVILTQMDDLNEKAALFPCIYNSAVWLRLCAACSGRRYYASGVSVYLRHC